MSWCRVGCGLVRGQVAAAALVVAVAVSACGAEDPISAPATETATTSTAAPAAESATATEVAGPEPAGASPATAAGAGPDESAGSQQSGDATQNGGGFVGAPRWSEIFDRLSAPEQSCIRGVLDEAGLDEQARQSAVSRRVFSEDFPVAEDAAMFACLAAGTANDMFVAYIAAQIESDLATALSDDAVACLGDWTAGIDLVAVVASTDDPAGDAASSLAFLRGLGDCVPDVLISLVLAEEGVSLDELSNDEKTCLRDLVAAVDWGGLADSGDDPEATLDAVLTLSFGLLGCLPDPAEDIWVQPFEGILAEEAISVTVGEPVDGALDSAEDSDLFVFEAVAGELYEMTVTRGTLQDPTLALYDADGVWLVSDDDSGGSLAPLVYWEASYAGPVHVEVGGYGAGSYTLTIAVSDVEYGGTR